MRIYRYHWSGWLWCWQGCVGWKEASGLQRMWIHADWMNLIYSPWQLSSRRGETSPRLQQRPQSSVKRNKKKNTLYHQNFPDSLLQIINHFITHPSFVADVSDCDAGQLGKQQIVRWVRETISLWNHECFQVSVLTMPTQVLVIQGLESSFLYTCSFPLVSPTTSSFNCS